MHRVVCTRRDPRIYFDKFRPNRCSGASLSLHLPHPAPPSSPSFPTLGAYQMPFNASFSTYYHRQRLIRRQPAPAASHPVFHSASPDYVAAITRALTRFSRRFIAFSAFALLHSHPVHHLSGHSEPPRGTGRRPPPPLQTVLLHLQVERRVHVHRHRLNLLASLARAASKGRIAARLLPCPPTGRRFARHP